MGFGVAFGCRESNHVYMSTTINSRFLPTNIRDSSVFPPLTAKKREDRGRSADDIDCIWVKIEARQLLFPLVCVKYRCSIRGPCHHYLANESPSRGLCASTYGIQTLNSGNPKSRRGIRQNVEICIIITR